MNTMGIKVSTLAAIGGAAAVGNMVTNFDYGNQFLNTLHYSLPYLVLFACIPLSLSQMSYQKHLTEIDQAISNFKDEIKTKSEKLSRFLDTVNIDTHPGFIYVMKRQDGIVKIGRTKNTKRRLFQHEYDYEQRFELICRFVVPDVIEFEKLALQLTAEYYYKEKRRTELRQMTTLELDAFIVDFKQYCIEAVTR